MRLDRLEPLREPLGYPVVVVPVVPAEDLPPGHLVTSHQWVQPRLVWVTLMMSPVASQ